VNHLAKWLPQAVHRPYFPILLILIANIVTGLFTFQDYGLSWDEPLFYQYAEAIPYAYSIPARLGGDFDIEKAWGPSGDHKIYGPAYLLFAKPVKDIVCQVLSIPEADAWHLVNFLTFQLGLIIFYALCLRWMSPWAAFGASLLYSTQPILWGHGWINPKDMPFTVFFMAAIYFGFRMVDALAEPAGVVASPAATDRPVDERRLRTWWKAIQVIALILVILVVAGYIFSTQVQSWLRSLILAAYHAPAESLLGKLFGSLAANAQSVAVEAYINKGLVWFARARSALAALALMLALPALVYTFWSHSVVKAFFWLAETLRPLPARPSWYWERLRSPGVLIKILLAGVLLGLVVSIRVIGPLAGILVCLYFFFKHERRSFSGFVVYALVALLAMFIAWPYLWGSPVARFVEVLRHMAKNPQVLPVLFSGVIYSSDQLPMTYLPHMLAVTLTWPVWPLFFAGVGVIGFKLKARLVEWRSMSVILLWFLVPFAYVLLLRPPMYDGYRHFLFLLPPAFIVSGMAFQALLERLHARWRYALVLLVVVVPGVIGMVRLHPYEYTYYNLLAGGTGGAFRRYETDFWLTCYKELMAQVNQQASPGTTLFVHRQPSIAEEYASPGLLIERFDPQDDRAFPGSLLLLTTRADVDLSLHPEAPEVLNVGRDGAVFCLVREIP
jgi:hypothetical protein